MKKSKYFITFIFILSIIILPIKTNALSINNASNFFYIGANTQDDTSWIDDANTSTATCEGDTSILGSVNDEDSVAWLLQQALNYLKVIGPLLVVVLSSIDFAKVIINSDDDAMKKAQKKLVTRMILAASLFFIPVFVEVILNAFGITSSATCGIE